MTERSALRSVAIKKSRLRRIATRETKVSRVDKIFHKSEVETKWNPATYAAPNLTGHTEKRQRKRIDADSVSLSEKIGTAPGKWVVLPEQTDQMIRRCKTNAQRQSKK